MAFNNPLRKIDDYTWRVTCSICGNFRDYILENPNEEPQPEESWGVHVLCSQCQRDFEASAQEKDHQTN
jgi:hypothetical protein